MARYDHLPLWHAALKTTVALERAVARFSRAHQYVLASDLRRQAQRVCALVVSANAARLAVLDVALACTEPADGLASASRLSTGDFNDFSIASSPSGSFR